MCHLTDPAKVQAVVDKLEQTLTKEEFNILQYNIWNELYNHRWFWNNYISPAWARVQFKYNQNKYRRK